MHQVRGRPQDSLQGFHGTWVPSHHHPHLAQGGSEGSQSGSRSGGALPALHWHQTHQPNRPFERKEKLVSSRYRASVRSEIILSPQTAQTSGQRRQWAASSSRPDAVGPRPSNRPDTPQKRSDCSSPAAPSSTQAQRRGTVTASYLRK